MLNFFAIVTLALIGVALFFFVVTRGALLLRGLMPAAPGAAGHVYPVYSNKQLIRFIDVQPVISAILLFQYPRLVSGIVEGMRAQGLRGKDVLITSCAFGNVIPRVVNAAIDSGARQVLMVDIIDNELDHARAKLPGLGERIQTLRGDATVMTLPDNAVSANIMFFLLHELPHPMKAQALREAIRVLEPGGKLYLAEFHRPGHWLLRTLSWAYFNVFEPFGIGLWGAQEPVAMLNGFGNVSCERQTFCFGNFQLIVATKK